MKWIWTIYSPFTLNLKEPLVMGKTPGISETSRYSKVLGTLKIFATRNLFGFSSEDIPVPERMEHLNWHLDDKFARRCGKMYQKNYTRSGKNEGMNLSVTQARKPEWIKENMDNPFRDLGWQWLYLTLLRQKGHYPVQEDTKRVTRPECSKWSGGAD